MYFLIEYVELFKTYIKVFGIKLPLVSKKNLTARSCTIKSFWKSK